MEHDSSDIETADNTWSPNSLCDFRPTDLKLVVESWKFHVHKDILEKSSDYFLAMFSSQMIESAKDVIDLHLVKPEQFKILIKGMYTGNLELTEDNVFGVVQVAEMLQIRQALRSKYIDFMKHNLINIKHCLELMYFCVPLNLQELYCDVRRFCLAHFSELRHTSSLVNLSLSELYDYLSDKYLVVDDEMHVVEAIYHWLRENKSSVSFNTPEYNTLKTQINKIVSSCVYVKDNLNAHDTITEAVFVDGDLLVRKFQFTLAKRPRQEDVFMFWALLTSTDACGLVDVVRLCLDTGNGVKFDSMTDVVEKPGYCLGSALYASGPYVYLSGGGPSFGKTNWIRKIWRFDVSRPSSRWEVVGDLIQFRRSHAMVIVEHKLYVFGGFGKFRTKNSNLDCLDLLTGCWDMLLPMPVHELSPTATASDSKIFYISSEWEMYCFSTPTKEWSMLTLWGRAPHSPLSEAKPVALFPVQASDRDCFAVVMSTGTGLRIPLFRIHKGTIRLHKLEEEIATVPNLFTCAGSVAINKQLALFFTSETIDDSLYGERETIILQKALIFDPNTRCFCDLPAVQNVRKAQSIIALPHLPSTFVMGSLDFS